MIDIHIDADYPTRWSKKGKRLTLPFEIDGDRPVRAIEVSMEGDGGGPYLRATFSEPRDGRNCRGLGFKPEHVGTYPPLVKVFAQVDDREPMAMRRGPHKVTVTDDAVFLPADPAGPAPFQIRAAFYYGWYPENWREGAHHNPTLGRYDSGDVTVIDRHIRDLEYGRCDAWLASWWGRGTSTDQRFSLMLERAEGHALRGAVYHERSQEVPQPTVAQIRSDLDYIRTRYASHPNYLKIGGRFVVFVYSAAPGVDCSVATRWRQANDRGDAYIVMKQVSGYADCPDQPDGWHQYGTANDVQTTWDNAGRLHSYFISPGFWNAKEPVPRLPRDLDRWKKNIRDMIASNARWQLVPFNEYGEDTQIESCEGWETASGYGAYLDALRANGGP